MKNKVKNFFGKKQKKYSIKKPNESFVGQEKNIINYLIKIKNEEETLSFLPYLLFIYLNNHSNGIFTFGIS